MRRPLFIAALLLLLTIPLFAQRRGFSSPRVGGSVAVRPGRGIGIRGGVTFGHNPRFGVFFGQRRFFHPRRSFFVYPYASYPYVVYPYSYFPPLGYDYVQYASQPQPAYMADHDTGLQNEIYRLQAEVDDLRRQQAAPSERQQYALNSPTEAPRPIPSARPPAREPSAPPTVLIFRDSRREEVHNYAVTGQTLWIFSEQRARKVPLEDLDLDATRQANEERGLEFSVHPPPRP